MVQKPLAARATRGRPDHLRSATGRKQERERYEQTDKLNRVKHSLEKTGDVKETLKLVRVVKDKKRRQREIS